MHYIVKKNRFSSCGFRIIQDKIVIIITAETFVDFPCRAMGNDGINLDLSGIMSKLEGPYLPSVLILLRKYGLKCKHVFFVLHLSQHVQ